MKVDIYSIAIHAAQVRPRERLGVVADDLRVVDTAEMDE